MAGERIPVEAVLFDALGTLVTFDDPAPRLAAALGVPEPAAAAAMEEEVAFYRAHLHEGRDDRSLADLRSRSAGVVRDALGLGHVPLGHVRDALLDAIAFRAAPGAAAVLEEVRARGLRTAVVSNWDASLPEVLARVGLGGWDAVVASAPEGVAKPDPEIFRRALARLGVAPAAALHVGDRWEEDVLGARAAGVRAVHLARGTASLREILPLLP